MSTRALILEDDYGLRTSLRLVLEQDGYDVSEADSVDPALRAVAAEAVDVMLVDLNLGDADGFTFIRRVRRTETAPIIVISARDSTGDVVAALQAGADDYVRKPFDVAEVKARLQAALRRPDVAAPGTRLPDRLVLDSHSGLVLEPAAALVRRRDQVIHMTRTELRILVALALRPGRVLTREVIADLVWPDGHYGDGRTIDTHLSRIRTKLGSDGEPIIATVRGLGYRLSPR